MPRHVEHSDYFGGLVANGANVANAETERFGCQGSILCRNSRVRRRDEEILDILNHLRVATELTHPVEAGQIRAPRQKNRGFGDVLHALTELPQLLVCAVDGPAMGGGFGLAYDPQIGLAFKQAAGKDIDLWSVWDAVRCPVLVLRGEKSDLLLPATAGEMKHRGPKASVVDIAGVGHAPALMAADQIATVREWLAGAP